MQNRRAGGQRGRRHGLLLAVGATPWEGRALIISTGKERDRKTGPKAVGERNHQQRGNLPRPQFPEPAGLDHEKGQPYNHSRQRRRGG